LKKNSILIGYGKGSWSQQYKV